MPSSCCSGDLTFRRSEAGFSRLRYLNRRPTETIGFSHKLCLGALFRETWRNTGSFGIEADERDGHAGVARHPERNFSCAAAVNPRT